MTTYLDRILERHRALASGDGRSVDELVALATSSPATRGFRRALVAAERLAVISEIKRRSPSRGDLNASLDPAVLARTYERGGASCLSVLTDEEFFGGSPDDLRAARQACALPVLRKDFTVCALDVVDARLMGADCVLLIAAALEAGELTDLHRVAIDIGLDVLVEVHDERELDVALGAGATLVGVNQRDLVTFEVDNERALRMAGRIPHDIVKVAESGVRGGDDARALRDAGYQAILVGETLVTSDDPAAAIAELPRLIQCGTNPSAAGRRGYRSTSMFVKICGITNEDDALFAVAMGADALGFVFAPSPRQVAAQQVYDITRRLPPEILTVGVFRDEHPSRVIKLVHQSGVKAAQLHGNEPPAQAIEVAASVRWMIKAFAAGSTQLVHADRYGTDLILVDSPGPGSGKVFNWDLAAEAPDGLRVILAGGLTPDNVAEAIGVVEPWGVDVSTGVELAPGRKDTLKVKRFIEIARAAAPAPYLGPDELPYDWADE